MYIIEALLTSAANRSHFDSCIVSPVKNSFVRPERVSNLIPCRLSQAFESNKGNLLRVQCRVPNIFVINSRALRRIFELAASPTESSLLVTQFYLWIAADVIK